MSETNYHYLFKIIIIGDTCKKFLNYFFIVVGKSNILSKYIYGRFIPEHEITIGCEFMAKNIEILDRNIRIQVWDTAGQESFRAITRSYYKNSACAVIVYDITNRQSFYNVEQWLKEVKEMCNKEILIVLVGNKIDLEENRKSFN